jgi:hypothetical protein
MLSKGNGVVKKLAIAVAIWGALLGTAAQAKTFVGVLWPLFGPLPAVGLAELVSEIKRMPDVEVKTYLHQEWPSLVEDIDRQPAGTHTVVVGYSLGANSSVFVANKAKYVDVIVALQPSIFSWNPPVKGRVGRMIEIYNPNKWMTFGGMGSKKLEGPNIEYIANNDSHPGAQFNSRFRSLVKSEITKFTTEDRVEIAQANASKPTRLARLQPVAALGYAEEHPARAQDEVSVKRAAIAVPVAAADYKALRAATPIDPQDAAAEPPKQPLPTQQPKPRSPEQIAFLDSLSRSVNAGDLFGQRRLTAEAMRRYAERTYRTSQGVVELATAASD